MKNAKKLKYELKNQNKRQNWHNKNYRKKGYKESSQMSGIWWGHSLDVIPAPRKIFVNRN